MSKLLVNVALAGLVACGSSNNNNSVDAGGGGSGSGSGSGSNTGSGSGSGITDTYDLSCNGNSAPTVSSPISVSGAVLTVNSSFAIGPLPDAAVEVCSDTACTGSGLLATETADASGDYSAGPFTTSTAIPIYFAITGSGDVPTYAFPPAPLAATATAPTAMVFPTTFESLIPDLGGSCTLAANAAVFGLTATDCNGKVITDTSLTLSVKDSGGNSVGQPPINVYQEVNSLDSSLGSSFASLNGLYLVCDVPDGAVTVDAAYDGKTFLANDVIAVGSDVTEASIRPGY